MPFNGLRKQLHKKVVTNGPFNFCTERLTRAGIVDFVIFDWAQDLLLVHFFELDSRTMITNPRSFATKPKTASYRRPHYAPPHPQNGPGSNRSGIHPVDSGTDSSLIAAGALCTMRKGCGFGVLLAAGRDEAPCFM
jgi:hypothetical protein